MRVFSCPLSTELWQIAPLSLHKPLMNYLFVCYSLVCLVDTSPLAFRARCFGGPSQVGFLKVGALIWCSNLLLLRERLGLSSQLYSTMPEIRFMSSLCLSFPAILIWVKQLFFLLYLDVQELLSYFIDCFHRELLHKQLQIQQFMEREEFTRFLCDKLGPDFQ